MGDLLHDLRSGLRQLRHAPGVAASIVLCLALGIGANTAVFSFANALFLRHPGVAAPGRLVRLLVEWKGGLQYGAWSYPDFLDVREQADGLADLAVEAPQPMHLATGSEGERIWGSAVSGTYFSLLGVAFRHGRGISPEEARGSHPVVVISHDLWRRRFGGDPAVVGRAITVNGHPFMVVGVAPARFRGPNVGYSPALWVPITLQESLTPGGNALASRGNHWILFAIGRLEPGAALGKAQASLDAVMARLAKLHPESNAGKGARLYPEARAALHPYLRGSFVGFVTLLSAVVGLVLLLASANSAGLLLARAASRRKEVALRLALGAGQGRLLRQLLAESLLLALIAGGAGLLLGAGLTSLVRSIRPPLDLPLDFSAVHLDGAVLAFTLLVSTLTGIAFGLVPALEMSRPGLVGSLKLGEDPSAGSLAGARGVLVAAQAGLSVVLLVAAGMVIESLRNASRIDLGFEPDRQLVASMNVALQGYDRGRGEEFFRRLAERVAALPGVEAVGYAKTIPLSLLNHETGALPEGHVVPEGAAEPTLDVNLAGPGYFEAMGIPLLAGRGFEEGDRDGPRAMVVNEALARRFWPGEDPLSKHVRTFGEEHRVVGVVKDGKYWTLGEEPRPYMYLPIHRHYRAERALHVRTSGDPAGWLAAVRREIRVLDPTLPVHDLKTVRSHLSFALLPMRLAASVAASCAALAVVLAAVGLYGLVAWWVSRSRREIGIRIALGATRRAVLRRVVGRGLAVTAAGLAAGTAASLLLARLATRLLYGVSPSDPLTYAAASALLLAVAFLASFPSARRATRIDPAEALRAE